MLFPKSSREATRVQHLRPRILLSSMPPIHIDNHCHSLHCRSSLSRMSFHTQAPQSFVKRSAPQRPRRSFMQPLAQRYTQQKSPPNLHQALESTTDVASPSNWTASSGRSSSNGQSQQPFPGFKTPEHWTRAASSSGSIPLSMTHCFQVSGPSRGNGRGRPRRTTDKQAFRRVAKPKAVANLPRKRGRKKSVLLTPPPSPKRMRRPLDTCPNGSRSKMQAEGSVTAGKKNLSENTIMKFYPTPRITTRIMSIEHQCIPSEDFSCIAFKNLLEQGIRKSLQAPLVHGFLALPKEQPKTVPEGHTTTEAYPTPPLSPIPQSLCQDEDEDEDVFETVEQESYPTPTTIEIATPRSADWDVTGEACNLRFELLLEDGGFEFFQAPFVYQASEGSEGRDSGVDLRGVSFEQMLMPAFMPLR